MSIIKDLIFKAIILYVAGLTPGSQYGTGACVVFVASVVLGNTQLDQGSI